MRASSNVAKKSLFYKQSIKKIEESKKGNQADHLEFECKNAVLSLIHSYAKSIPLSFWTFHTLQTLTPFANATPFYHA